MSCDTFLCFLDTYQVLIAGALAIVAAGIAYRGARRQASAILDAENQRAAAHRRAVAAALYAELVNVGARLFADSETLMAPVSPYSRRPEFPLIDISIFAADPSAVGVLPSDEAFMVTQVYKLVMDVNRAYARASDPVWDSRHEPLVLAEQADNVARHIRVTLRGIRDTAGVAEDKAHAMTAPWSPEESPEESTGADHAGA